jgi:hypothetical protein
MKGRHISLAPWSMPILRLAYATQFLIALIAVFLLWSQVGGQDHLDLMPWFIKLALGAGAAFAVVKATAASVSREPAWNGGTLKWCGILLAILIACGLVTLWVHKYAESDDTDQQEPSTAFYSGPRLHNSLLRNGIHS